MVKPFFDALLQYSARTHDPSSEFRLKFFVFKKISNFLSYLFFGFFLHWPYLHF